jgi:putative nucleotidyltransferase with HDIG domain
MVELARGLWESLTGDCIAAGEGVTARVIAGAQPYVNNHVGSDERIARPDVLASTRAVAGVPLIVGDEVIGVLWVGRSSDISQDDVMVLTAFAEMTAIAVFNASLLTELRRSNRELALAYDETLEGWSRALELRDQVTEGHTRRVTELTVRLARAVGVGEEDLVHVRRGALLHDIGKVGIPDSILTKPGPLSEEEWGVMRRHPVYAYQMLWPIDYLRPAVDIPYCHHEKWDGSGYPRGLEGEEIPIAARIFAVVDVWDALRSERPYRRAWPEDTVLAYLADQSGRHFDPRVVEAFLELLPSWSNDRGPG